MLDWAQVEERIVEDNRNKWDRKAVAGQRKIASCLQRFKTEPLYRRKSEPLWVGSVLSSCLRF